MTKRKLPFKTKLKIAKALVSAVRNPENTSAIFDIGDAIVRSPHIVEHAVSRAMVNPDVALLFKERYTGPAVDLERLARGPEDSLGQIYAKHMIENKLDPNFYRKISPTLPEDYLLLRARQTHDIWHVLTGYDTSLLGELSVQAFYLAQFGSPIAGILLGTALLRTTVKDPASLDILMSSIVEAWQRGKNAKPLLSQKWEELWSVPLRELRARMNLETTERSQ